jgi:hypothetical protein
VNFFSAMCMRSEKSRRGAGVAGAGFPVGAEGPKRGRGFGARSGEPVAPRPPPGATPAPARSWQSRPQTGNGLDVLASGQHRMHGAR